MMITKNYLVTIFTRGLIAFIVCVILFSLIKIISFTVPVSLTDSNVNQTVETLKTEGNYPKINAIGICQADNFTNAIMINIASHGEGIPIIKAAFGDYHYCPTKNPIDNLGLSINKQISLEDNVWSSYSRYWQGWIIVIKPLLCITDLAGIRVIFSILMLALLTYLCFELYRQEKSLGLIIAFIIPFTMISLYAVCISLSLFFSIAIALTTSIGTIHYERRREKQLINNAWSGSDCITVSVSAFSIGAITVFFDFLCTPILTLGLPLLFLIFLRRDTFKSISFSKILIFCICCCIAWVLGYGLLWLSKWILSSMILGQNIIEQGFGKIAQRAGNTTSNGETISFIEVAKLNLSRLYYSSILYSSSKRALFGLVIVLILTIASLLLGQKDLVSRKSYYALLFAISIIPFAWFLISKNHSGIHYWFTYRILLISMLAYSFGIWTLLYDKKGKNKRRIIASKS